MNLSLSAPVRKLLAVSLLALVLVAVWGGAVQPLMLYWSSNSEETEEQAALLSRYRAIAVGEPGLVRQLAEIRHTPQAAAGLLSGPSKDLVLASLQNRVRLLLEQSGAQLESAQELPVKRQSGYERLGLRVQISAPIGALRKTLYALEISTGRLFLDDVTIRASDVFVPPRNGRPSYKTVRLTIRGDVYGYWAGPHVR